MKTLTVSMIPCDYIKHAKDTNRPSYSQDPIIRLEKAHLRNTLTLSATPTSKLPEERSSPREEDLMEYRKTMIKVSYEKTNYVKFVIKD